MIETILEKETTNHVKQLNDFEELLNQSFNRSFKIADLIEGTIVKIEKTGILVDIGGKTEAILPLRELSNTIFDNPESIISINDKKVFYIIKEANEEGQILIYLKRVHFARSWENLNEIRKNKETIITKVISLVKGGVIVEIFELRGFIPASQLRTGIPHERLIDKELSVKVLEADAKRNKLILSEKLFHEEERQKIIKDVISKIEEEQVIEGEVVRLADFGAFIDIMGIDGLLPISEISWQRIKHPSDILSLGQKLKIKILKIDYELNRISLSLKRMEKNPWEKIEGKFQEGQIIKGIVNKITNFGAFVSIFPGVEALLPAAEMDEKIINPYEVLTVNQEIEVLIKRFTPREKRIGLSIKDLKKENL